MSIPLWLELEAAEEVAAAAAEVAVAAILDMLAMLMLISIDIEVVMAESCGMGKMGFLVMPL